MFFVIYNYDVLVYLSFYFFISIFKVKFNDNDKSVCTKNT